METLESLRAKIDSAEKLASISRTMKTMSAVSIRQSEEAIDALAEYAYTIELGLQALLQAGQEVHIQEPSHVDLLAAIVFGSNQGLVGHFDQDIVSYALQEMEKLDIERGHRVVLAVGTRVASRLRQAGQLLDADFAMASSVAGITPLVQEILLRIDAWRSQHKVQWIILFYNASGSEGDYHPNARQLLPVDPEWLRDLDAQPWLCHTQPICSIAWEKLFGALIRQYFFVSVYRSLASSLASENASRLSSMEAAEQNIQQRLNELRMQFRRLRQTSITQELLDVVTGYQTVIE